MIGFLLGLIDPISRIAGKIADVQIAKAQATTDQEKVAADERIKALEAQRDVMIAESSSKINTIIRSLFGIPPAIYLAKLFVWDKVLGWGTTDPLSPVMEQTLWIVVGFYFLQHTVHGTVRIMKR